MHLINSFKLYKTKLIELKRVTGKSMLIVADFNNHLTITNRKTRKKSIWIDKILIALSRTPNWYLKNIIVRNSSFQTH